MPPWLYLTGYFVGMVLYSSAMVLGGVYLSGVPDSSRHGDNKHILRNTLLTGAILIRTYREDNREIKRVSEALDEGRRRGYQDKNNRLGEAMQIAMQRKDLTFRMYQMERQLLKEEFSQGQAEAGLGSLKRELEEFGGLKSLVEFSKLFVLQTYRPAGRGNEDTLGEELLRYEIKE